MEELHLLGQSELEKLDQLVSDYLLFRSFKHTQQQLFLDKRQPLLGHREQSGRHLRDTIQRILNALDNGDYPRLVTLWDTYVTQKIGTVKSTLIAVEAREAEFLANLLCSIYPFQSEVIQSAGSPAVAAKVAARSMGIFKHYLESKGNRLALQKDHEFFAYRNVHKIAFLPSHPQYKHMFAEEWRRSTRERITRFMEKFFTPTDLPVLCTLFERLTTKTEAELKEIFRRRERKLVKFSRSMYTLSNDLLTALESGKTVDKAFLVGFRGRFNNFAEVLEPDRDFEEEMDGPGGGEDGIDSPMAGSPIHQQQDRVGAAARGGSRFPSPHKTSPPGKLKIMHKIADLGHLDYVSMARDIAFMSSEVGTELNGLLTRDFLLSLADATVKSQVAMQGCVLLSALEEYITRPDKEVKSQSSRNSSVTALCRADVLGLRTATTQSTFVDISSGSIGLESRSITRFMFSLAEATRKIPEAPLAARRDHDGMAMELSPAKLPPYEKLLLASEVIAEHIFRLIAAISSAPAGIAYLHTFGVRLTAAFADFLVALPVHPSESASDGDSSLDGAPLTSKRGGARIKTWCLMALVVMAGQSKTNQLVVLKRGGMSWLSKTLAFYIIDAQQHVLDSAQAIDAEDAGTLFDPRQISELSISTVGEAGKFFEMALSLLGIIICSPEAQRYLVGSLNMQRETESLVGGLLLLAVTRGRTEYQASMIISILQVLLRELSTRELVKTAKETTILRKCVSQGIQMSIDFEIAKMLLGAIDSTAPTIEDANATSDLSEILDSVAALQMSLPISQMFSDYASGMTATGLTFLLRYTSSAGRIFAGEERSYEEQDGRLRSPPIQVNRQFKDGGAGFGAEPPPASQNQPKMQPTLPRTPSKSGNPRFISHGREIASNNAGSAAPMDDEDDDEGVGKKKKSQSKEKGKGKGNQSDEEDDEGDEEEEAEEEEAEEEAEGQGEDEAGKEEEEDEQEEDED